MIERIPPVWKASRKPAIMVALTVLGTPVTLILLDFIASASRFGLPTYYPTARA
jgi:hypothetical protein